MVLPFAGLGPGSRPPLPTVLELLLWVPLGGVPVLEREELLPRQGFGFRNLTNNLNLSL
jgi:hypothetical protein